jgi:hypothetical protein
MLNDSGLKFSDYLVMLNHAPDTNPGSFQYCFRVSFLKNCRSGFQPRFLFIPSFGKERMRASNRFERVRNWSLQAEYSNASA